MASDEWKGDSELRLIDTLEILIIFEDHVRELEKEHDAAMRKAKMERARSARKARDEFKVCPPSLENNSSTGMWSQADAGVLVSQRIQDLLQELVQSNKVTARSRWKDSIAIFGQDHRYLNLLGKPGSTYALSLSSTLFSLSYHAKLNLASSPHFASFDARQTA
jgi:pre-mRNA-processing factor 40